MATRADTASVLTPYVPRVALEWAETTPDELWRQLDGSLVFVDISGFTALSERLARRGRQGAEELTGTLSGCFADLLEVAYSAGGSLLKFGGDALLLLFDGADHASRAVTSALHMRAAMREVGRVTTSVGNIRLRMSIGVHSGELHLFRVGESHRELIVTGPGASVTVDMESTADAGEIVISPATAARIEPSLVGAAKQRGFLLRNRAIAVEDARHPPVTATPAAREAIPTALRDHLASAVEPEHRQATIAFVHFDEIDALIESEGAPIAAEALDDLTRAVQRAADEEGVTFLGSDVDRNGGKIILVGGAPRSLGDDEGRMLRALRQLADGQRRLPTRFGVHRGHVFVGEVGPAYRRTYTVMGDTVNLAARLMAKAAAGQILATRPVVDHATTEFEIDPLPPFIVKGKSEPIEAVAVGTRGGVRQRVTSDDLPFTGRDQELSELLGRLDRARAGSGGLVEISGDAGLGKSRLIAELAARAEGAVVVTAFCEISESSTPYFALRHLLRGVLGVRDGPAATTLERIVTRSAPQLVPWVPLLADVLGEPSAPTIETGSLEPEFRRDHTRRVVRELVDAVVRAPCLLVVEDGQWIDTASAEILEEMAAAARHRSWLICLARRPQRDTYRPDDDITLARLTLAPLGDDAAGILVAAATKEALLRPDQRDAVIRQAGGNPLFLEGLLRSVDSLRPGAELPESLEALLATEIDRMPRDDRRLLRFAAVLGPLFQTKRLLELVDDQIDRPTASLRRLERFLEPAGPGWVRFRNLCFQQAAYESLAYGRRRELHALAGVAIEGSASSRDAERHATLSFHFLHAQDYERCWQYSLAAAEAAEAKYANVEAVELYERALIAGHHLGDATRYDTAMVWESLGDVCLTARIFERAKAAFGRARQLRADDSLALARLYKKESLTAMHRGQQANVVRWANRGLGLLVAPKGAAEQTMRSELRLLRGEHCQRMGKHREALAWCDRAIADALSSGDRAAIARAYTIRDMAALDLGRLDEVTHLSEALSIWEELGNLSSQATALTILGVIAYYEGRWDDARALYERGRHAYLRTGDVILAGYGTCNIADILIDQGRGQEAVGGLHEVLDLWRSVGHPGPVAGAQLNLGRCAVQQGDLPAAFTWFEAARQSSGSPGDSASIEADGWLAECHLHSGKPDLALPLIDAALRREVMSGGTTFTARLRRVRGYALAAAGRSDEALDELARSLDAAQARGSLLDRALTLESIAEVRTSAGAPPDAAADAERHLLLERLGIVATFSPVLTVEDAPRSRATG